MLDVSKSHMSENNIEKCENWLRNIIKNHENIENGNDNSILCICLYIEIDESERTCSKAKKRIRKNIDEMTNT